MQQIPIQAVESRDRRYTETSPTIAYRRVDGTPGQQNELVLLLHGVGSSASTWNELLPLLHQGFTIVAPDYRGHGYSEAPPVPYVIDDYVTDVLRLLDELGVAAVHIVGFSIGAVIAEAVALAAPERVSSLVLLNTIGDRTEAERARALERLEVIRSTDPAEVAATSAARWFTPAFIESNPELVAGEVGIVSVTDHVPYAASYEVLATTEIIDQLSAITAPTLIITGENDVGSTPRMSRAVQEKIARSQMVVVDDLQHYLHIEGAQTIADLVNGFIRSNPAEPHQ
jgi:pimeloyl-ACP methyl ester carboxylesterase